MPDVSEMTRQRMLATMIHERDSASRASWPYHPCEKKNCDYAEAHNKDSAKYADQRREAYLRVCDRRIERYKATGEICRLS